MSVRVRFEHKSLGERNAFAQVACFQQKKKRRQTAEPRERTWWGLRNPSPFLICMSVCRRGDVGRQRKPTRAAALFFLAPARRRAVLLARRRGASSRCLHGLLLQLQLLVHRGRDQRPAADGARHGGKTEGSGRGAVACWQHGTKAATNAQMWKCETMTPVWSMRTVVHADFLAYLARQPQGDGAACLCARAWSPNFFRLPA